MIDHNGGRVKRDRVCGYRLKVQVAVVIPLASHHGTQLRRKSIGTLTLAHLSRTFLVRGNRTIRIKYHMFLQH